MSEKETVSCASSDQSEAKAPTKKKTFTVSDVHYEQEYTLGELVAANRKFQIIDFHRHNMSVIDIIPAEYGADELFRLNEDINEIVLNQDESLEAAPEKFDVVLAPKSEWSGYYRALVANLKRNKTYAVVYYLDVGGSETVKVDSLKPATETIMRYPRLAYTVVLDGMSPANDLILSTSYEGKMKELRGKTLFTVELGEPLSMGGALYCKRKVRLMYTKAGEKIDLKDTIMKMEKWEWETFSNLHSTDEEMCQEGKWSRCNRSADIEIPVFGFKLEVGSCAVAATVEKVEESDDDAKTAILKISLLSINTYMNFFTVLHSQLERYAKHITKTKFYPANGEPLMFRLVNEKFKEQVKCIGRWFRGVRIEDHVYLYDVGEMIPFRAMEEGADYEMRKLYNEFFKLPFLCINVRPVDKNGPLSLRKAEKIFKKGFRYNFVVTKDRETESPQDPYEVTFSKVNEQEENKKIEDFLTHLNQKSFKNSE